MATTTPNFGWPVPTSTDLVKDGATAIEALGDAIDASMVDLEGGTTGQVLAKASNTDMDFAWVTTDDTNAIQNSIVDAKGDLIAASAADTPARLAVGNNGETIVADNLTSTGLRYQAPYSQQPILNGGLQVWQRGTAATAIGSGTFLADRWQAARAGFAAGATQSRQVTGDTTNLPNIQYCLRVQRDSGTTGTSVILVGQNIETVNSIPFAGKTVTMSFYARKGADYSAASNVLQTDFASGTGTDQNIITSGTLTGINSTLTSHTLTGTWQRFTVTKNVDATATQLVVVFRDTPVGTAGTNDYFEVTGVQVELGSVATPFHTYAGTIQGELSAAQRYYWRQTAVNANERAGYGSFTGSTNFQSQFNFPVTMRAQTTAVEIVGISINDTAAVFAVTGGNVNVNSPFQGNLSLNVASGGTTFRYGAVTLNTASTSYIGFSAEL